tara:strand:+ start:46 stop:285 length:240 start_codon:yes stop_codon:yes gene_type:complete
MVALEEEEEEEAVVVCFFWETFTDPASYTDDMSIAPVSWGTSSSSKANMIRVMIRVVVMTMSIVVRFFVFFGVAVTSGW